MVSNEIQVRVRYAETDQMGIVYYANYAVYFEIGRTELMRNYGFPYRSLEAQGIILPVVSLSINYKNSARYDDLLTVRTSIRQKPGVKVVFHYEIYNQHNTLLVEGSTALAFVDTHSRRPRKAPEALINAIAPHFEP